MSFQCKFAEGSCSAHRVTDEYFICFVGELTIENNFEQRSAFYFSNTSVIPFSICLFTHMHLYVSLPCCLSVRPSVCLSVSHSLSIYVSLSPSLSCNLIHNDSVPSHTLSQSSSPSPQPLSVALFWPSSYDWLLSFSFFRIPSWKVPISASPRKERSNNSNQEGPIKQHTNSTFNSNVNRVNQSLHIITRNIPTATGLSHRHTYDR